MRKVSRELPEWDKRLSDHIDLFMRDLSIRLRAVRMSIPLSQYHVARALDLDRTTYRKKEQRKIHTLTVRHLLIMSCVFGVPVGKLLGAPELITLKDQFEMNDALQNEPR